MSISATYFIDRKLARAAKEMDLLLALCDNKVPREAGKIRALSAAVVASAKRLNDLTAQIGMDPAELKALLETRVKAMRQAQFDEVKRKRDLRAAYEAERQALLTGGALAA